MKGPIAGHAITMVPEWAYYICPDREFRTSCVYILQMSRPGPDFQDDTLGYGPNIGSNN